MEKRKLDEYKLIESLLNGDYFGRARKEFVILGFLSGFTGQLTSFQDIRKEVGNIKKCFSIDQYFRQFAERIIESDNSPIVTSLCEYAGKQWRLHIYRNCNKKKLDLKISNIAASIALGVYIYDRRFRSTEKTEVNCTEIIPGD